MAGAQLPAQEPVTGAQPSSQEPAAGAEPGPSEGPSPAPAPGNVVELLNLTAGMAEGAPHYTEDDASNWTPPHLSIRRMKYLERQLGEAASNSEPRPASGLAPVSSHPRDLLSVLPEGDCMFTSGGGGSGGGANNALWPPSPGLIQAQYAVINALCVSNFALR